MTRHIKVAIVWIGFGIFCLAVYFLSAPTPADSEMQAQLVTGSPYDLNGDGLVTQADLDLYAVMFNRLNFNRDAQVDIFDQVELAGAVQPVNKIYLPIMRK